MNRVVAVFMVAFGAGIPTAHAATRTAASCARTDVAAAIAAATYGDTVVVPAGNCTWTTLAVTKAVTLQGAGIGVTNITSAAVAGGFVLVYDPDSASISNDLPFKLTGFTFNLNNASGGLHIQSDSNTAAITKVQIYGNAFSKSGGSGTSSEVSCIRFGDGAYGTDGEVYGVIYNNTFTDCPSVGQNYGLSEHSWNNFRFVYGSAQNVYWEDNVFRGNSAFHYGGHGGRYVARFNTYDFTNGYYSVVWDVHGNQAGLVYGTMGCEIYSNTLTLARSTAVLDHRGGMCMVFGNASTGTAGAWQVRETEADSSSPTTNPQPQHASGSYYFLNTHNGANVRVTELSDCCGAIAENAQYFNHATPFNGTAGVGSGPLASRPATCTAGVGYWAVDQGEWNSLKAGPDGEFYTCTATNTWSLYYRPYPYPHPLRAGTQPPAPPTNVRIIPQP